jgi:hypothetical protein
VAVILSISVAVIAAPGAVTGLVLEIDQEEETDLAQVAEIDPEVETDLAQVEEIDPEVAINLAQVAETGQAQDRNQALEEEVTDPVPEQDLARARNRVQGQDQAQDRDRVRVTGVPLVVRARVEVLHPGTVNVVHRAAPANHAQEVHRAEVVVDAAAPAVVVADAVAVVAEVAVADVDVDLE